MPIRLKILSIAVALLLVFGIVVGISAVLQRQVANEIHGITRYHDPLTAAIANFDVISFEYELLPLRLMRRSDFGNSDIDAAAQRERKLAEEMGSDFDTAEALLTQAVGDAGLSVESRLVFAHLQGLVAMLHRKLPPFVEIGQGVMQAIAEGRLDDARRFSLGFRDYEEAFGADTAAVRRAIIELTGKATVSVHRKQMAIEYMSFVLFALAALLGLGIGIAVATAVIRTLRHLVEAATAVGAGELSVLVPVRSGDEIGQLATAFNAMVVELRAKERIKDTFGKFVDPRIVSGLIGSDTEEIDHADRRVVTVFFLSLIHI